MNSLNQRLKSIQTTRNEYKKMLDNEEDSGKRVEYAKGIAKCNTIEKELLKELKRGD